MNNLDKGDLVTITNPTYNFYHKNEQFKILSYNNGMFLLQSIERVLIVQVFLKDMKPVDENPSSLLEAFYDEQS